MTPSMDVFAAGNFAPLWLGSAETLAQAIELMKNSGEGVYFVFSQANMEKVLADSAVGPKREITPRRVGGPLLFYSFPRIAYPITS
jgi:hypothetical protein